MDKILNPKRCWGAVASSVYCRDGVWYLRIEDLDYSPRVLWDWKLGPHDPSRPSLAYEVAAALVQGQSPTEIEKWAAGGPYWALPWLNSTFRIRKDFCGYPLDGDYCVTDDGSLAPWADEDEEE